MTIAFFGEKEFVGTKEHADKLTEILKRHQTGEVSCLFCGQGAFEEFAMQQCKECQKQNPKIAIKYIVPRFLVKFIDGYDYWKQACDWCLYSPYEETDVQKAVQKEMEWMIFRSAVVVGYVNGKSEDTKRLWEYANEQKSCINLYDL